MTTYVFAWMNVASVASLTGDCHVIKGNDFTNPSGEVPYQLLSQSYFYCPNLITRDKEICYMIMS